MAIKIPIGANASEAVREAKRAGDAIDAIGDTLSDLARESARSSREANRNLSDIPDGVRDAARDVDRESKKIGDNLSDGVERGTEQAEDSVKELEKTFKDSVRDMQRADGGGGLGKKIAADAEEGTGKAKESFRELGNEARQNASETFSSFDGSAQSFADGIQGTLGGIVSSLGPVGAALGAAGALGIGLVTSALQKGSDNAAAFKQKVSDLTTDLVDTGRRGSVSLGFINDKLKEMASSTDGSVTSLKDLRKVTDDTSLSYKGLAQALGGNTKNADKLIDQAEKYKKALQEQSEAAREAAGLSYRDSSGGEDPRIKQTEKYIDYLKQAKQATQEAQEAQSNYARAGGEDLAAAAEASQAYADSVQSAYADAGANVEDFVTKAGYDLDGYAKKAQENLDAIVGYQKNMADAQTSLAKGGHDAAIQYLQQLGPDAAPLIAAFVKAPEDERSNLASIWDGLGSTGAQSFNSGLQTNLDKTPASKHVTVVPDLAAFNRAMAEATRQREAHIKVYEDNMGGRRQGMGTP